MASQIEVYEDLIYNLPEKDSDIFWYNHKKFSKKVQNAINAYAFGLSPSQIIGLYDSTFFGKADEGFLFTNTSIIGDNGNIIFYNEIEGASFDKDSDSLIIHTTNGNAEFYYIFFDDNELLDYLNSFLQ